MLNSKLLAKRCQVKCAENHSAGAGRGKKLSSQNDSAVVEPPDQRAAE